MIWNLKRSKIGQSFLNCFEVSIALNWVFFMLLYFHITQYVVTLSVILPLEEVGGCFQPVSLAETAEATGPWETLGLPTVLETDCNCCLHRMMSFHLKPLETGSLRWRGVGFVGWGREERIGRWKHDCISQKEHLFFFHDREEATASTSFPECAHLCCLCTFLHWEPSFHHLRLPASGGLIFLPRHPNNLSRASELTPCEHLRVSQN